MDLWVVAAAAGAGYIAKFLQKSKDKEGLNELVLEESSEKSNSTTFLDQFCPIRRLGRRELRREEGKEESSSGGAVFGGGSRLDGFVASEATSTSGFEDEMVMNYGSNEDYNVLSLSGLSPRFNQESEESRIKGRGVPDKSSLRGRRALRSKNLGKYSVKPLSSLDSCLIAQLYTEHAEMEEYVFSTFPSPAALPARPLLVTDGSRIISRASSDSSSLQKSYTEGGLHSYRRETVSGVPPLPKIGPLQLPKKPKQKRGNAWQENLSSSSTKISSGQLQPQGSPDSMFVFCLGITFGVLSTIMANKREVEKLNELLKQTENLVQDLHEELEMKDSLTVKELPYEGYQLQENNNFADEVLTSFSSAKEINKSLENDTRKTRDQKSGENSESRSKIEAELEAELERLELNMSSSCLDRRLSGLVELDPDCMADIVQGELRVDLVNGVPGNVADSEIDTSGISTTQPENVNYAVSPRELSLRLHEVIQSRLEERIMELETALESSQKRLHSVESKQMHTWRNYSNSEVGSSSQGSPPMRDENNTMAQPLFLNLSDDALDAYNEAYEALNVRIAENGTDEHSPQFMACKSNQFKEELNSSDRSVLWSQNGGEENGSGTRTVVEIQDESDNDDDEMARLLIKQIVEKARQGSPVVLNAQKMLFSMDEKAPF